MEAIKKIMYGIEEFPTLPTVYMALNEVISNQNSTAADVANVISADQACSTKILKTANSSIYGFRGKIDSVAQAIFFIGFQEVKNLVLTLGIMDIFRKTICGSAFNPVDLWKHSIGVGTITRTLGEELKVGDIENYLLAGVLHDIGKLLFLRSLETEYMKTIHYAIDNKIGVRTAEVEIMGITHTLAGELVADRWRLPVQLKNAIRYHHSGMVKNNMNKLVACVHLADILARMYEMGNGGDMIIPEPNSRIWEDLGMEPKTFMNCWEKIMENYEESLSIFVLN